MFPEHGRWQRRQVNVWGDKIDEGIVITKYGHVKEPIERIECFEAGHPVLILLRLIR